MGGVFGPSTLRLLALHRTLWAEVVHPQRRALLRILEAALEASPAVQLALATMVEQLPSLVIIDGSVSQEDGPFASRVLPHGIYQWGR